MGNELRDAFLESLPRLGSDRPDKLGSYIKMRASVGAQLAWAKRRKGACPTEDCGATGSKNRAQQSPLSQQALPWEIQLAERMGSLFMDAVSA